MTLNHFLLSFCGRSMFQYKVKVLLTQTKKIDLFSNNYTKKYFSHKFSAIFLTTLYLQFYTKKFYKKIPLRKQRTVVTSASSNQGSIKLLSLEYQLVFLQLAIRSHLCTPFFILAHENTVSANYRYIAKCAQFKSCIIFLTTFVNNKNIFRMLGL